MNNDEIITMLQFEVALYECVIEATGIMPGKQALLQSCLSAARLELYYARILLS